MEPNHALISGLRPDTASAEERMGRRIRKAATDSDWDATNVNVSSRYKPSIASLPDLIYYPFADSYSSMQKSLIAGCCANRVHRISSCCWQPKKALCTHLVGAFPAPSLPGVCCTPAGVWWHPLHRLLWSRDSYFHCFQLLFSICWWFTENIKRVKFSFFFTVHFDRFLCLQLHFEHRTLQLCLCF